MEIYLERISQLAQIIGIPLAVYTIIRAALDTRKDRDLQISMQLTEVFREKWEDKWRSLLDGELNENAKDEEMLNFLNWINWVGVLIKRRYIHDHRLLFENLSYSLKRGILAFEEQIVDDISDPIKGSEYWNGVVVIAEKLDIKLLPPQ